MKIPLIDTHCHIDSLKTITPDECLQECRQQGIEKLICIAYAPSNLSTVIDLAKQYDEVYCSQGIHPHDANTYTEEVEKIIIAHSQMSKKVVAIGEIGLDYFYMHSPRDVQIKVFEQQLELAKKLNLPVVIHTRDADEDTAAILRNFSKDMPKKGVLHSFSSGLELAATALDLGFYLGFNGMITFKKAENVREALRRTPLDRILLETDAPYLAPVPHRGKENRPSYLPHVAQTVIDLLQKDSNQLFSTIYQNSQKCFSI